MKKLLFALRKQEAPSLKICGVQINLTFLVCTRYYFDAYSNQKRVFVESTGTIDMPTEMEPAILQTKALEMDFYFFKAT